MGVFYFLAFGIKFLKLAILTKIHVLSCLNKKFLVFKWFDFQFYYSFKTSQTETDIYQVIRVISKLKNMIYNC
jgi:hypothetical protein